MQVTELKNEGLKREYKVVLPADDISAQTEERIQDAAKTIKMPGFREGKVPVSLVKKKHGAAIVAEVMEKAVSQATQQLLEEKKIFPVLQPKIDVVSFDEGKDLEYTVALEIYPEIPSFDYSKIKLEKATVEVEDKEVEDGMERLRTSQAKFEPVKEARAAKEGDAVSIDFVGKIDGEAFEGGAAKDFRLELGSGQFIEGFEEQLVGTKAGDKVTVKVTFPENYGSAELAGKPAEFDVEVKDVLEKELPEANDEFAESLGYASLDKLNEDIKKQIGQDYEGVVRFKIKKELFDGLDKLCEFEIPTTMLEMEFESLKKQAAEAKDAPEEGSEEFKKQQEELEEMAARRVRLGLALSEIGRVNDIVVTEEELRKAVFSQARNYPGQEQQVIEFYQKNPQALEQLRGPILEDKVVDFLLDNVSVTEKKLSAKELQDFISE